MLVEKAKGISEFLQSFEESEPNLDGEKTFREFVANHIREASKHADSITTLPSQMQNEYLQAMSDSVYFRGEPDWHPLLNLIEQIINDSKYHPELINSDMTNLASDILENGMRRNVISYSLKERVWDIILKIVEIGDMYNEPEHATSMAAESFKQSVKNIGGKSYHVLYMYLVWCNDNNEPNNRFKDVKQIFERYLTNTKKYTISRHAVFGYFLSRSLYINRQWTLDVVIKKIESSSLYFKISFWHCYLFNEKERELFITMRSWYREFLTNREIIHVIHDNRLYRKTIEHVTIAFLYDVKGFDEILTEFINDADDKSLECCFNIAFIASTDKENSIRVKPKIHLLWKDKRFVNSSNFEIWFKESIFDKDNIDLLLYYIQNRTREFPDSEFPIDRLAEYIDDCPLKVAQCIKMLVGRHVGLTHKTIQPLLDKLCKNNNPEIINMCREIDKKIKTTT